jgi:hypothetical protein
MFKPHPELPGIIVDWFVTTLIKTPGAPPDTIACANLDQIRMPGGLPRQRLIEAGKKIRRRVVARSYPRHHRQ